MPRERGRGSTTREAQAIEAYKAAVAADALVRRAMQIEPAELAAMVPGARGVDLAGAGHLTIVEEPAAVTRHLVDFLRQS